MTERKNYYHPENKEKGGKLVMKSEGKSEKGKRPNDQDSLFNSGKWLLASSAFGRILAQIENYRYPSPKNEIAINKDISSLSAKTAKLIAQGGMGGLYVVCDGVGGHGAGEVASSIATYIAVKSVVENFPPQGITDRDRGKSLIVDAMLSANKKICQFHDLVREDRRSRGIKEEKINDRLPETTIVIGLVDNAGNSYIGSIGDSRAYKLDVNGQIRRITEDDSLVEMKVRQGRITRKQSYKDPQINLVSCTLGTFDNDGLANFLKEYDKIYVEKIEQNEEMVFCCDGVWEGFPPTGDQDGDDVHINLGKAIYRKKPKDAVEILTGSVAQRNTDDNLSAIVVRSVQAKKKISEYLNEAVVGVQTRWERAVPNIQFAGKEAGRRGKAPVGAVGEARRRASEQGENNVQSVRRTIEYHRKRAANKIEFAVETVAGNVREKSPIFGQNLVSRGEKTYGHLKNFAEHWWKSLWPKQKEITDWLIWGGGLMAGIGESAAATSVPLFGSIAKGLINAALINGVNVAVREIYSRKMKQLENKYRQPAYRTEKGEINIDEVRKEFEGKVYLLNKNHQNAVRYIGDFTAGIAAGSIAFGVGHTFGLDKAIVDAVHSVRMPSFALGAEPSPTPASQPFVLHPATPEPTPEPTITPHPTAVPSATIEPTHMPTATPTVEPTRVPTPIPTATPHLPEAPAAPAPLPPEITAPPIDKAIVHAAAPQIEAAQIHAEGSYIMPGAEPLMPVTSLPTEHLADNILIKGITIDHNSFWGSAQSRLQAVFGTHDWVNPLNGVRLSDVYTHQLKIFLEGHGVDVNQVVAGQHIDMSLLTDEEKEYLMRLLATNSVEAYEMLLK